MTITSLDRRKSRYIQGGRTETFANRLGFWDRKIFERDSSDEKLIITAKYAGRPWVLAHDRYKDVNYTWFILQYNNILDIETEFVAGATIFLPTPYRLRIGLMSQTS